MKAVDKGLKSLQCLILCKEDLIGLLV